MDRDDCRHYDYCSAPLCPISSISLKKGIWYPDEEICRLKEYGKLEWVKNQRKIARKTNDTDTFYTVNMLDRKLQIRKGIKGLDPNAPNTKAMEKKWIESRQVKRDLTDKEKEVLRERLRGIRKKIRQDSLKKQAESGVL